jgi:class 3 adenylate cyclase/tetratricopeptide (TPR) repeat protein
VARVLAGMAQQKPLAIVFENLQWADPASLALLGQLLPLAAQYPVLFLLVARSGFPESAGRVLDLVRRNHAKRLVEIELGPLDPAQSDELVDGLAPEGGVPEEARTLILERANGNPLRIVTGVFLAPALHSESDRTREGEERTAETERRRATVLFTDITGFTRLTETLGDQRAYSIVADALKLLDEVARRHGGTVDKYLGDCVLALFGVPEAIEDAPRAAVNAAIEMRQRIRAFNGERKLESPLDVHAGINTGLGISGDVSGPMLREFAVMGASVDVANRLADLAPAGRIYVGSETHRFTSRVFEYRAVEATEPAESQPASYELLSEQVQIYRRAVGLDRQISSDLVGRDAELDQLREKLEELKQGRGSTIGLIAEAGIGKSRLTAEVRASDAAQTVLWLEGRSLSIGSQLSFHPFADLLRAWSGINDEDEDDQIPVKLEAAIARVLPAEVEEVYPFLATVMGVPLTPDQRARIEAVQGELLEKLIRERVTRVLQRISEERPLVLVFDDLHWADLSSIELLESLQRLATTHPVLFLHVCRPGFPDTSGRILEFVRQRDPERLLALELRPLDREASRLLINNLFKNADIPHSVRTLIAEKAGGNPFYVEEVVRSLIEEGAVELEGDGFRATEKIHSVVIPGTVQEVLMARIDRLKLRQKEVIQIASVIGRSFHFEVLRQIFPDKDALLEDLGLLEEAGFVVPWDRLQGVEFAFKHPLIQEVAYDSLLQKRREALHLQAGNAIEAALTENMPGYHGMLAYHFSLGRDLERAEESLFRAGDEAARSAASNEALHFFRSASKLYFEMHGEGGDPYKKAKLERNVGLALFNRGQLIEAVEHFDAALRYFGQRVPSSDVVRSANFARDMVLLLAQWYLFGKRRRLQPASERELEMIDTMFRRSLAETTTAPTRFVFDTMATLRKISKLDPATIPEYGGMYAGAIGIFSYGGVSFALGEKVLGIAGEVVDAAGSPELYFYYRAMSFVHNFLQGDWSDEHRVEEDLVQENYRAGRLWEVTTYVGLEAEQHVRRGDFARAQERIELIDEIWETYDYDLAKTNHYWLPMILLLEQRRLPQATRAAEVYYDENPEDLLNLLALSSKATAQSRLGDQEGAEASLAKGAEIVARSKHPFPLHLSSYVSARLLVDATLLEESLARGDQAQARALRKQAKRSGRQAVRVAARVGYRKPEIFRSNGRHAWLVGRSGEALQWWRRSLEVARTLGMRPELGRTCQEVGLRLSENRSGPRDLDGRDGAAYLDEARGIFTSLGLEWDLARLESSTPP